MFAPLTLPHLARYFIARSDMVAALKSEPQLINPDFRSRCSLQCCCGERSGRCVRDACVMAFFEIRTICFVVHSRDQERPACLEGIFSAYCTFVTCSPSSSKQTLNKPNLTSVKFCVLLLQFWLIPCVLSVKFRLLHQLPYPTKTAVNKQSLNQTKGKRP